ncbi:hypothetical protein CVT25_009700 [Psilocybe cyanescens]|uniref:DUF6593 domain-containing protein n=1 Tax=Psilocybe cyanescens TaxID=93625 RepID=A0A409WWJ1_PSICY|nr:hypothetical protein CVT25_009700 [Psilocybe cyanescens]
MYTNPFGSSGPSYGSLPLADNPSFMKFTFDTRRSGILNCNIIGPNTLVYFNVSSSSTITTISRRNGDVYATIEWTRHPIMQIYGETGRQLTAEWIRLSPDRIQRMVTIRGRNFFWIPRGSRICLYGDDDETSGLSGEIAHISRADREVALHISLLAFNTGFLDTCVLATVLFMSGRNID